MHQPLDERRLGRQRGVRPGGDRSGIVLARIEAGEPARLAQGIGRTLGIHRAGRAGRAGSHLAALPQYRPRRRRHGQGGSRCHHRRLRASHAAGGLPAQALLPKHALTLVIGGELGGDRAAGGRRGDGGGLRIEASELVEEPATGVAWRTLAGACAQAEAVDGDAGRAHGGSPWPRPLEHPSCRKSLPSGACLRRSAEIPMKRGSCERVALPSPAGRLLDAPSTSRCCSRTRRRRTCA